MVQFVINVVIRAGHLENISWSFSNLQMSSFGHPVPTVASDSCIWLTGVEPSAAETHLS